MNKPLKIIICATDRDALFEFQVMESEETHRRSEKSLRQLEFDDEIIRFVTCNDQFRENVISLRFDSWETRCALSAEQITLLKVTERRNQ